MSRILVEICCGTTCYVMGGAELEQLAEHLPPDMLERVEITACHCLGRCRDGAFGRAPFVRIAGRVFDRMTLARAVEVTVAAVRAAGEDDDVR
jgi:NADH:ubiquinone oxidoreductase subunit E